MSVPSAPTNLTGVKGDGSVALSWSVPASNGGSDILSYVVRPYPPVPSLPIITSTGTSATYSGLLNGHAYRFTVVAVNANGNSKASAYSPKFIPSTIPFPPSNVIATPLHTNSTGNMTSGSIRLSWGYPVSADAQGQKPLIGVDGNGGSPITGYTVTCSDTSVSITPPVYPNRSIVISGITNTNSLTYNVTATNANGTSAVTSNASSQAIVSYSPSEPTGVTASYTPNTTIINVVNNTTLSSVVNSLQAPPTATVQVSWQPPSNLNNCVLSHYLVTWVEQGKDLRVASSSTQCNFPHIPYGTDTTFTVRAVSLPDGPSNASVPSQVLKVYTTPHGVTGVKVVNNKLTGDLTISWNAPNYTKSNPSATASDPSNTGGYAITGYSVTYVDNNNGPLLAPIITSTTTLLVSRISLGSGSLPMGITSVTVIPLTDYITGLAGRVNDITIPAVNISPSIISAKAPDAPVINTPVIVAEKSITVSWNAPNSNGSVISDYVVTTGSLTATNTAVDGLRKRTKGTSITFTKLAPGDYNFRLVVMSNMGNVASAVKTGTVLP